ncbi:MAG TPA: hypothetical protein IAC00_00220 [Candidatus Limivicinus faecipullorum]|nr:hypothetical protein [Candidatus Limivicinus faecipullorum]
MRGDKGYEDIIYLPHPVSRNHPPMPVGDRAAQFAPFAALTGYEEAVEEAARLTECRIELDRDRIEELDRELRRLREHIKERPEADIVCFKADERKTGGALVTLSGRVKKIDEYEGRLIMADGSVIAIEDIYGIDLKLGESPAEEED